MTKVLKGAILSLLILTLVFFGVVSTNNTEPNDEALVIDEPRNLQVLTPLETGPLVVFSEQFNFSSKGYPFFWSLNSSDPLMHGHETTCTNGIAVLSELPESNLASGDVLVWGAVDLESWYSFGNLTIRARVRVQSAGPDPYETNFKMGIATWHPRVMSEYSRSWSDTEDTGWIIIEAEVDTTGPYGVQESGSLQFFWGYHDVSPEFSGLKVEIDSFEILGEKEPSGILQKRMGGLAGFPTTKPTVYMFETEQGEDVDEVAVAVTSTAGLFSQLGFTWSTDTFVSAGLCVVLDPDVAIIPDATSGYYRERREYNVVDTANITFSVKMAPGGASGVNYVERLFMMVNEGPYAEQHNELSRFRPVGTSAEAIARLDSMHDLVSLQGEILRTADLMQTVSDGQMKARRSYSGGSSWSAYDFAGYSGSTDLKMEAEMDFSLSHDEGIYRVTVDYCIVIKHLSIEMTYYASRSPSSGQVYSIKESRSEYHFNQSFDYIYDSDYRCLHVLDIEQPDGHDLIELTHDFNMKEAQSSINGDMWYVYRRWNNDRNASVLIDARPSYFDGAILYFQKFIITSWSPYYSIRTTEISNSTCSLTLLDSYYRIEAVYQ